MGDHKINSSKTNTGKRKTINNTNPKYEERNIQVDKIVQQIFKEHEKFIIIGLTGRIGSGCSTTAKILSREFHDLELPKPKLTNISRREDREYEIIYKYANQHWRKFFKVTAKDVITTFVLENDNERICKLIFEKFNKFDHDKFKDELNKLTIDEIREHNLKFIEYCKNRNQYSGDKAELFQYISSDLPFLSNRFKQLLLETTDSKDAYTLLYQFFGNNIRKSGNCLDSNNQGVNYYALAERINCFIKIYRDNFETDSDRCCIVIDSIKTPFEAAYLRDRYSAFYLIALNIDEQTRFSRLNDVKGLSKKQILQTDICEYPKHLKALKNLIENGKNNKDNADQREVLYNYDKWFGNEDIKIKNFTHQNVEECIQKADIHLNSSDEDGNFLALKKKIVRYITLIMHPGIILPTDIERCMQIAFSAKVNSGCVSRQVGAVVTDSSYRLRSIGWNDAPECVESCIYRNLNNLISGNDSNAYSDYELGIDIETNSKLFFEHLKNRYNAFPDKIKDLVPVFCFKDEYNAFTYNKDQIHTRALHGEEKAFLSIIKHGGESVKGGFLFTTSSPCELCAKKAYDLGITTIYYIEPYPGITQAHVLGIGNSNNRMVPNQSLFSGAIGRAYTQLYTPVISLKDELGWRGFESANDTRRK